MNAYKSNRILRGCGSLLLAAVVVAVSHTMAGDSSRQLMPSSHRTGLIISEIMYNPPYSYGYDLEYVELFNTEPFAVDISGYRLAGGIKYTFAAGTILAGRSFAVVARDPNGLVIQTDYGSSYGPFGGKLEDKGETLQLIDARGTILLEVPYQDEAPWPVAADGAGHSLVMTRPDYGEADPRAWSASAAKFGSPGTNDPGPAYPGVCINEILAVTNSGLGAFIEVYNSGTVTQTLTDCYLTDRHPTNSTECGGDAILVQPCAGKAEQAGDGKRARAGGKHVVRFGPAPLAFKSNQQPQCQCCGKPQLYRPLKVLRHHHV